MSFKRKEPKIRFNLYWWVSLREPEKENQKPPAKGRGSGLAIGVGSRGRGSIRKESRGMSTGFGLGRPSIGAGESGPSVGEWGLSARGSRGSGGESGSVRQGGVGVQGKQKKNKKKKVKRGGGGRGRREKLGGEPFNIALGASCKPMNHPIWHQTNQAIALQRTRRKRGGRRESISTRHPVSHHSKPLHSHTRQEQPQ